jgi:hypothetical protein
MKLLKCAKTSMLFLYAYIWGFFMAIYPTRRLGPAVAVLIAATSGGCSVEVKRTPAETTVSCEAATATATQAAGAASVVAGNTTALLSDLVFAKHKADSAEAVRSALCPAPTSATVLSLP